MTYIKQDSLNIIIAGLSITSSWGNGHATTYRALVKELCKRGHRVTFFERDLPWYASNRDLPLPPYGGLHLYSSFDELRENYSAIFRNADAVVLGSFVPEGALIGEWICEISHTKFFYDIDTPLTIARLETQAIDYLTPLLIPRFDAYLSFTGGPILKTLEDKYGSPHAEAFYCSVDLEAYFPLNLPAIWDAGYMGTYSEDRQSTLGQFLFEPARRNTSLKMVVAGPQYPVSIQWPENVSHIEHIPPDQHRSFYNSQKFTLNITRADMIRAGYAPSVRIFEAAACGVPIISDYWEGIDTLFVPGEEIIIARTSDDVVDALSMSQDRRKQIAEKARIRIMNEHTAAHRAAQLESLIHQLQTVPSRDGQQVTSARMNHTGSGR